MDIVKLLAACAVIYACARLGRRDPALAGLLATMPLTGLIVLLWLAADTGAAQPVMLGYCKGVLFGILPSLGFFGAAYLGFTLGAGLWGSLGLGAAVWLAGAWLHRALVH